LGLGACEDLMLDENQKILTSEKNLRKQIR
jgi:hypothetical protein